MTMKKYIINKIFINYGKYTNNVFIKCIFKLS